VLEESRGSEPGWKVSLERRVISALVVLRLSESCDSCWDSCAVVIVVRREGWFAAVEEL